MANITHARDLIAGSDPAQSVLLLPHGSGYNEHSHIPMAQEVVPTSPVIGLRRTAVDRVQILQAPSLRISTSHSSRGISAIAVSTPSRSPLLWVFFVPLAERRFR
jgi:predicted esterase